MTRFEYELHTDAMPLAERASNLQRSITHEFRCRWHPIGSVIGLERMRLARRIIRQLADNLRTVRKYQESELRPGETIGAWIIRRRERGLRPLNPRA